MIRYMICMTYQIMHTYLITCTAIYVISYVIYICDEYVYICVCI